MPANQQHNGILLTLLRYALNVATVVGGIGLVMVLMFVLVTQAKPSIEAQGGAGQVTSAQATTAPAQAVEAPNPGAAVSPETIALGKELFQSQGCAACHTIEGYAQGVVGPNLTEIGVVAEARAAEAGVPDAEAYLHASIVAPNDYISPDCPAGACVPGTMPANFSQVMSEEQIDAVVQYLLTLRGE